LAPGRQYGNALLGVRHQEESAAITDLPMPQPAAQCPSPRNVLRQRLTIFIIEYYQILIATHLPTPEGWKAELA